MSNPYEWHVASDKEGFFVEDEFGEEVGTWINGYYVAHRWQDFKTAQAACNDMIKEAIDNYEPPDPPGWEGGFAKNH